MSDKNKPNPHQAEHQAAGRQNNGLDVATGMAPTVLPFASGPVRGFHFGTTNFEGHDLNEMIDIVESADPALLESTGDALLDAHDAIKKAADELRTDLGGVDWEGEAHRAFTTWGQSLVTTAEHLAGYAHVVGTQVLAAGSGLASVRNSMPPRDGRTDRKKVDDIPEAKRVESNDEYTAAVKAEKHRQEAINQMYRLASFYTVSQGTMAKAEEPAFPKMPDVGVPEPRGSIRGGGPSPDREPTGALTGMKGSERLPLEGSRPSVQEVDDTGPSLGRHIGTEIDSVGTLPPETTKPSPGTPPLPSGPTTPPVTGAPPLPLAAAPPVLRGGAGRLPHVNGAPGNRSSAPARGSAGGLPGGTPAGRAGNALTGPTGRSPLAAQTGGRSAGPMGRGLVAGTSNSAGPRGTQGGPPPRTPVTGAGPQNPGRTGAGRPTNGVVGGTPVTRQGGSDTGGARVPRGTVIGDEGTAGPRSMRERPGQRGVFGVPDSTPAAAAGSPQASDPARKGHAGTPNGRAPETSDNRHVPSGTRAEPDPMSRQKTGNRSARGQGRPGNASSTD